MTGEDLAIFGILWGTGFAFALAAVTMLDSGRKKLVNWLWGVGGAFVLGALLWPWIADTLPALKGFMLRLSENGLVIKGLGVAIFVLLGFDILIRSRAKLPSESRGPPVTIASDDPLADAKKSDLPIRWNASPELGIITNDGAICVTMVGHTGINSGEVEFELQDAYLISKVTGAKWPLFVITQGGPARPADTNPIPPGASMTLRNELFAHIPERDFLRDWGTYDLVALIDGKEHRRTIDRQEILAVFNQMRHPDPFGVRGPRVAKRG
jgi:hypothetical protein